MTAVTMEVRKHFHGKAVCVPQRQPDYQGAAKMQELTPLFPFIQDLVSAWHMAGAQSVNE